MLLRSGKRLSRVNSCPDLSDSKQYSNPIKTNTTMTSSNTTNTSVTLVSTRSAITPFQGRVNGACTQSVENWITSVEAHLLQSKILDPDLQLQEAKSYLDLAKGDLGVNTCSRYYNNCTTWEALKEFLRFHYGGDTVPNVALSLRNYLLMHDRQGKSFQDNNATLYNRSREFIQRLGNSPWATSPTEAGNARSGYFISSTNLENLLLLSIELASLPDSLVNSFDEDFSPTSCEKDVIMQIKKHVSKCEYLEPGLFKNMDIQNRKTEISPVSYVKEKPQVNSSQSTNNISKTLKCYNCGRPGHFADKCRVQFCNIHRTSSHRFTECRDRAQFSSGTPFQGHNGVNSNRSQMAPTYNKGYSGNRNQQSHNPRNMQYNNHSHAQGRNSGNHNKKTYAGALQQNSSAQAQAHPSGAIPKGKNSHFQGTAKEQQDT